MFQSKVAGTISTYYKHTPINQYSFDLGILFSNTLKFTRINNAVPKKTRGFKKELSILFLNVKLAYPLNIGINYSLTLKES